MFYVIFFKTSEGLLPNQQKHVALCEGRKAKIKLVLRANPKKGEPNKEPKRGKHQWLCRGRFYFPSWLIARMARVFLDQSQASKPKQSYFTFDKHLKIDLLSWI